MRNTFKLIKIIAIASIITFTLIGCDTDSDDGSNANTLVKYGDLNIASEHGGGTIPIYKTADVTDAQMTALVGGLNVIERVQAGYDAITINKAKISTTKVSAIWITNDTGNIGISDGHGKFIMNLKHDLTSAQMKSGLEEIATYYITMLMLKNALRLAYTVNSTCGTMFI